MTLLVLAFASLLGLTVTAEQQVYEPGRGVTLPVVVKEVHPNYTAAAMKAKVQGRVILTAVVLDDGRVGDVAVTQHLHPELDEEAITAFKQWEFKPGTREGKPVAVRVHCQLSFTLKR